MKKESKRMQRKENGRQTERHVKRKGENKTKEWSMNVRQRRKRKQRRGEKVKGLKMRREEER